MERKPLSASAKRKRRRRGHRTWVTYWRCFLLTLGMLFFGFGEAGFWVMSRSEGPISEVIPVILVIFAVVGLWTLGTGLFGSSKDVDTVAGKAPLHEGLLIVVILAAPLYWILKFFESRCRRIEEGE